MNGNITDVKSMSLCIKERDVRKKVIFIADKGFFSSENITLMQKEELSHIIPLQRSNSLIDFSPLQGANFKKGMQYFNFQDRMIRYYSYRNGNYDMLRVNEEKDYLNRIDAHPETHSKDGLDQKLHRFGTLTIVDRINYQTDNDTNKTGKKKKKEKEGPLEQIIYQAYKQRNEIEVMFDSYKNCLAADVSYMQNRYVLFCKFPGNDCLLQYYTSDYDMRNCYPSTHQRI